VGPRRRVETKEQQGELPARLIAAAERVQQRMNPSG
jgi:hypothetical protein